MSSTNNKSLNNTHLFIEIEAAICPACGKLVQIERYKWNGCGDEKWIANHNDPDAPHCDHFMWDEAFVSERHYPGQTYNYKDLYTNPEEYEEDPNMRSEDWVDTYPNGYRKIKVAIPVS